MTDVRMLHTTCYIISLAAAAALLADDELSEPYITDALNAYLKDHPGELSSAQRSEIIRNLDNLNLINRGSL